jgi:hypothetical protein
LYDSNTLPAAAALRVHEEPVVTFGPGAAALADRRSGGGVLVLLRPQRLFTGRLHGAGAVVVSRVWLSREAAEEGGFVRARVVSEDPPQRGERIPLVYLSPKLLAYFSHGAPIRLVAKSFLKWQWLDFDKRDPRWKEMFWTITGGQST